MAKGYVVVLATSTRIVVDCTLNFMNYLCDYPSDSKSLVFCQGVSDCEVVKKEVDEAEKPENIQEYIDIAHTIANKHPMF